MVAMDRRTFVRAGFGGLLGAGLYACRSVSGTTEPRQPVVPRLTARPAPPEFTAPAGVTELGLAGGRDGLLSVPEGYDPEQEWPLFVALHGAGGDADAWRGFFARAAEQGIVMMAPDSRGSTWDLVRGGFGPDVEFMDEALEHTFRRVRVDPARICLGGFSDGASYALSLGLPNGDLFTHLAAFSPGFLVASEEVGRPEVFISHGTRDPILSFGETEQRIVPLLQGAGYEVAFHSFDGGHEVPADVARAALEWFLR